MDKFEGFTEEEIKNLTSSKRNSTVNEKQNPSTAVYKKVHNKSRHQNRLPRKNVARERLLKGNYNTFSCSMTEGLAKEARLHIPKIPEEEEEYETEDTKNRNSQSLQSEMKINTTQKENAIISRPLENKNIQSNIATENTVASSKSQESLKITDSQTHEVQPLNLPLPLLNSKDTDVDALEQFETRQKLMEEQNRQRKEILKRALADRTKKTHEEVKRLNEIEGELKKLDLLLSNDVAIIRNQIESASIDFMEAQKRYDKAEKEFLDAKLDLFNKKERKELLTSHLCTIIEQNEMRKAKKLSDLMLQLEVGPKSSLITSQISVEYKVEDVQQEKISLQENKKIEQKLNVKNEQENLKLTEVKEEREDNNIINS